jgi:hypothetical protein
MVALKLSVHCYEVRSSPILSPNESYIVTILEPFRLSIST